jgi:hypothetical protein
MAWIKQSKRLFNVLICITDHGMNSWLLLNGQNGGRYALDAVAPLPLPGEISILPYI